MAVASSSLEAALEELYGTSPGEFTKARDAIAKRLKTAGDTDAAATLRERRKPTQTAWILNQLARRHPDDVAELVDVGRELAREQRKALRGEAGASFRESIDRQRKVVSKLTQLAGSVMKDLGIAAAGHLEEIASALRAALVDPVIGAKLEEGRFEKAPEAAAGFAGPEMIASLPATKAAATKAAATKAVATKAAATKRQALAVEKTGRARNTAEKAARARMAEERAARKAEAQAQKKARAKERAEQKETARARKKALADVRAAEAEAKRSQTAADKARTEAEDAAKRAEDAAKEAAALAREAVQSETRAADARKALARLE